MGAIVSSDMYYECTGCVKLLSSDFIYHLGVIKLFRSWFYLYVQVKLGQKPNVFSPLVKLVSNLQVKQIRHFSSVYLNMQVKTNF